ncbi:MAG TPA: GtrA family protein [Acidimicrobiales bacterium]|nr:GtrA family protein [Acidimicrobiales bacterium]
MSLWRARASRAAKFAVVGGTGLLVNQLALAGAVHVGLYYLLGAIVATQCSSLWNFALSERWVFREGADARRHGTLARLGLFLAMNNLALGVRGPLLYLLTTRLGVHYLLSNLISLLLLTVVRFALADSWIWSGAAVDGPGERGDEEEPHGREGRDSTPAPLGGSLA